MSSSRKLVPVAAVLLLIAAAAVLAWPGRRPASPPPEVHRSTPARPLPDSKRTLREEPAVPGFPAPVASPHATGTAEHRDWVKVRGEELMDLSWMEDRASLDTILAELTHPDAGIRGAALAATLNFGSRDAIPRLEALAATAGDPREKEELAKAAAHLKLPTLREVLAKRKAAAATPEK
jgi:hypothetical protein